MKPKYHDRAQMIRISTLPTQKEHSMLRHPTLEKLNVLKLTGMSRALAEQETFPDIGQLGFEERLGLLADRN
jgi:hypothetical protein